MTRAIDLAVDSTPGDEVPRLNPWLEVGNSGLKRTSGYVDEEFLPQLRGRKANKVYREILDNSSVIGGWYSAVTQLLRQIEWRVEPASSRPADRQNAEFTEQCMEDMSHSWGDMITEMCSFVGYGWNASELCYKRREGPWYTNRANNNLHRSKYDDKRVGWAKIPGRSQDTLLRWIFDDRGETRGMVQQAPPRYQRVPINIEKLILVRTTIARGNPEGRSLLRNVYQAYYYLKRHMEIEAVGVSRDLAGMPFAKVPAKYLNAKAGTADAKMLAGIKNLVTTVARNEQEGVVWPHDLDDKGNPEAEFELLNSGGSRQFDTAAIIDRYKTEMLQALLADFLQVGHENNGGSYALHTDKTGLFRTSINALAQMIADAFNRQAIPRLFELNGIRPDELPKIVPNNVDPPDLTQLASFLSTTGNLGMQWFPDPTLDKFLRDAAGLPKLDESIEHSLEQQQRQQAILNVANQRLQAIQVQQQAEQGQMQAEQQRMGVQQQAQALEAGPQQPGQEPADPNDAKRSNIAADTDRVKLDQEKAKLQQLKKPAPRKPVGKSWEDAFGVNRAVNYARPLYGSYDRGTGSWESRRRER